MRVEASLRLAPEDVALEQNLRPAVAKKTATLRHTRRLDLHHGPEDGGFRGLQIQVFERAVEPRHGERLPFADEFHDSSPVLARTRSGPAQTDDAVNAAVTISHSRI
ncbi:MAG: hypothetical protein LBE85_04720 [Candidatus Accumulibacter sp.]|nr:hypothetical protein [Accumulibacter sp.]